MPLYELKDLLMICLTGLRQGLEKGKNFIPVAQIAAGQLPDDIGMAEGPPLNQEALKAGIPLAEMSHPDRSIDQHHP
jgi:hypothetical protein